MREINFQEKVGIYSWFKKEKSTLKFWLIVLDKTCEFGEFYALVWKLQRRVKKDQFIFIVVTLDYMWLESDGWRKAAFGESHMAVLTWCLCYLTFLQGSSQHFRIEEVLVQYKHALQIWNCTGSVLLWVLVWFELQKKQTHIFPWVF